MTIRSHITAMWQCHMAYGNMAYCVLLESLCRALMISVIWSFVGFIADCRLIIYCRTLLSSCSSAFVASVVVLMIFPQTLVSSVRYRWYWSLSVFASDLRFRYIVMAPTPMSWVYRETKALA